MERRFEKLDPAKLTEAQFGQMIEIERHTNGIEPYTLDMLRDCVEHLANFVCLEGDAVRGFLTMNVSSRYYPKSLYVVNIGVHPDCRRQGIAQELLHQASQFYLAEFGDKQISLDVMKTNRAMALYQKLGFQLTDIPSKNGDTDVVMAMPLAQLHRNLEQMHKDDRLNEIRRAEALSHTEAYNHNVLFQQGSWLSRPVKTVLDILPLFAGYEEFRALDLGCGVGRNCIPVAQAIPGGTVDCVDILELAVEKLMENAVQYGVADRLHPRVSGIDKFPIPEDSYDLVLGISVLEHMDCRESMVKKLYEIRDGVRADGAVCFVLNTGIREHDKVSGEALQPQFEILMDSAEMMELFGTIFEGWTVLHSTVRHQKYDTPRERGIVELDSDVVTFAARKENQ